MRVTIRQTPALLAALTVACTSRGPAGPPPPANAAPARIELDPNAGVLRVHGSGSN